VVLTDTVGFIRDLPEELFAAFRATFEEMADADLLLHVVDAIDPDREQQISTTEKLLAELELHEIPRLLVYNKTDLLDAADRARLGAACPDAVLISATERESTRPLLRLIGARLNHRWQRARHAAEPLTVAAGEEDLPWADRLEGSPVE
jgi:GTP-binding protein HflX